MASVVNKKIDVKTAWLAEGIRVLSQKGPAHLSIDSLAFGIGRTKGSFYHHFSSRVHYIQELLEYYLRSSTVEMITESEKEGEPAARLNRLRGLVLGLPGEVELAIRAWALYDPVVKKYQDTVDRLRLNYLKDLYLSIYRDQARAARKAYSDYSSYIGFQQLKGYYNKKELARLIQEIFIT